MEIFLAISTYLRDFLYVALLAVIIYFIINIGNRFVDEDRKFKITKKQIYYFLTIVVIVFIFYQGYILMKGFSTIISSVFFSIIFAYILNPLVNILERKGIRRLWSVLLIYVIITGIIFILSVSIIPNIVNEFRKLAQFLPSYFNELYDFVNNLYTKYTKNIENLPPEFQAVKDAISSNLSKLQNTLVTALGNFTNSILGIFSKLFTLILIPILTFYFLKDKDYFKKKIILIIPKKYRNDIIGVAKETDLVISKFIRGQLIVAAFVGITTAIGLVMLGIDFALIIGIIAGIANIIPYFGPIIGIFPAVIFALLENPIKVLWVIILFTAIQQFESNILSPKIVGESVGLHPVVVILVLLIGGSYFGIVGMLLAVPIAAMLKIVSEFILERLTQL